MTTQEIKTQAVIQQLKRILISAKKQLKKYKIQTL